MAESKMPGSDSTSELLRAQYPSNSKMTQPKKDQKKKRAPVQMVANGTVSSKKEKLGTKLFRLFIADDVKDVKRYFVEDMLVPGIKMAILSTLGRMFYANGGGYPGYYPYNYSNPGKKPSTYTYGGRSGAYPQYQSPPSANNPPRMASGLKYITFEARSEADAVICELLDRITEYGSVSVRDYYEASGVDSDFTDENWGWTKLPNIHPYPVRGGYTIELPAPIILD